jgi:hypothetical protein
VKYLDIQTFLKDGYLHELNRQVLHPLGLALEVVVEEDGSARLGGVWDFRDDPGGMIFGEDTLSPEKALQVARIQDARRPGRVEALGYWVQPVPGLEESHEPVR